MNTNFKRFTITIVVILIAIASFALSKDSVNAISIVSYEQSWHDYEGTLALKNNTNEDIHNLTFQITYLNMSGQPLDYQVYTKKVEIAPGMTKQIDIPAYEYVRQFSYYKSEADYVNPHKFKIKFKLKGYNQEAKVKSSYQTTKELSDESDDDSGKIAIVSIVAFILVLGFVIGLYVLVAVMAQKRNRSAVLWVFVSLFTTPILVIIILLCIGRSHDDDLLE